MRTIRKNIDVDLVNDIVNALYDNGYEHADYCQGVMLDSQLFFLNSNLKILGYKARKYLFFVEKYLNEWSSCYEMVLTDSQKVYDELYYGYFESEE